MKNLRLVFQIGLVMLLLVLLAGALMSLPRGPREPSYQGKPLTRWIHDLDSTSLTDRTNAVLAIRETGTNALPFLVQRLNARDSRLKLWFENVLARQSWVRFHFRDVYQEHHEAMRALAVLGPEARTAVGDVAGHVGDFSDTLMATYTLWQIGTNSIPALETAMTNANNAWVRVNVIDSLGHVHDPASIPVLLDMLRYYDHPTYSSACGVLGQFTNQADQIVPVLIGRFDGHSPAYEYEIAGTLGRMGASAKAALPNLLRLVAGPDDQMRGIAARSMMQIDSDSALVALTNSLASTNATIRSSSAWALKLYGAAGKPAVPALMKCLDDPDDQTRSNAAAALDEIWPGARALPILLERMSNTNPAVRIRSALALAKFGDLAKPAVPAMVKLWEDNQGNPQVRTKLYDAVTRIDPTVVTNGAKVQGELGDH